MPPDGGIRLARPQPAVGETPGESGGQARAVRRILVIDDEPGIRRLAARALPSAGFSVALAATGRQGLDVALHDPCDLVLLDLRLPDLNGEELLRRLRRERPRQAVLIWSAAGDRQAASSLGACGYLAKPCSLAELIRSVAANLPGAGRSGA